jgi:hypothetical protein
MGRKEDVAFAALVLLWIREGLIDEQQAVAILVAFRDGKVAPADLPAPAPEVIRPPTAEEVTGAAVRLTALIQRIFGKPSIPPPALGRNPALRRLSDRVRADFSQTTHELAANVSRGEMSVGEWEAAFADHVAAHVINQHMVGSGSTEILPEALGRITAEVTRQRAYAARFADQMSIARAEGTPMTEAYIAARSEMYGGAAYAEYWRASEQAIATSGDLTGWVSEYHALDDGSTCADCANADTAGPYMLSDGPWPGDVCRGKGHCRCERVIVYDPIAYAKLTG